MSEEHDTYRRARLELEGEFDRLVEVLPKIRTLLETTNRRLFWLSAAIVAMADLTDDPVGLRFLQRPSLLDPIRSGPRGPKPPRGGHPATRLRRAQRSLDALRADSTAPACPPDPANRCKDR